MGALFSMDFNGILTPFNSSEIEYRVDSGGTKIMNWWTPSLFVRTILFSPIVTPGVVGSRNIT
jgi:hypothetical protein